MNRLFILSSALVLLCGCAWLQQANQDYQTGKNTPLVNGEVAPAQEASPYVATASVLPFVGPFAGVLGVVLTGLFTWQRGAGIRKNNGLPVASSSTANVATTIIQTIANVAAGAFTTTGTTPSTAATIWQRVWKVALAVIASGTAVAVANPSLQTYLLAHPVLSAVFVAATSGIAGVEKALSSVPTIATTPTTWVVA